MKNVHILNYSPRTRSAKSVIMLLIGLVITLGAREAFSQQIGPNWQPGECFYNAAPGGGVASVFSFSSHVAQDGPLPGPGEMCLTVKIKCKDGNDFICEAEQDPSKCSITIPAQACADLGIESGTHTLQEVQQLVEDIEVTLATHQFWLCTLRHELQHAIDWNTHGIIRSCETEENAFLEEWECLFENDDFVDSPFFPGYAGPVLAGRFFNACLCSVNPSEVSDQHCEDCETSCVSMCDLETNADIKAKCIEACQGELENIPDTYCDQEQKDRIKTP